MTNTQEASNKEKALAICITGYKNATEVLSNPQGLLVRDFKLLERIRETSLYEIATLLDLPDLPPPGQQLSKEQWLQCIDFIKQRD